MECANGTKRCICAWGATVGQFATCGCKGRYPCRRLATEEDLLCNVCRGGCEPFFYVDAPADRITTWAHQNEETIEALAEEIEQGRIPPGDKTEDIP